MKDKLKKIIIPFIFMMVFNLGSYYLGHGQNFGEGLSPHFGILLVSGLILGPYGAIGAAIGNLLCDLIRDYPPILAFFSSLITIATSYLGYKLWYGNYKSDLTVTNPKLNSTNNVILFLSIVVLCGMIYATLHGKMIYLFFPDISSINEIIKIRFFLSYINASFIMGIVGIWISNKINFFHIPKTSKNKLNEKLYKITGSLLIFSLVLSLIVDYLIPINIYIAIVELIIISLLLLIYLKRPITSNIKISNAKSIPEDVMNIFHLTILFIIIIGIVLSYDLILLTTIENVLPLDKNEIMLSMMSLIDAILLIFLIPSIVVLKYIEMKVIDPILSFSKIDHFIHENEKIESEGLIDLYSKYINEKNEIGTLANSYTNLINFNNNYIENIQEIEGEKKRIQAEIDIATKIQVANLPTTSIVTDDYIVNGYSKPAKEVGGDFFDYYKIDDDNLAIIIGDASGKGVPAAILAMITQVMIKQMLQHDKDPSKILYLLNNQLSENNTESMFITLWVGIYNKTTKKLNFSNAGHEPPLIKENNKYKSMTIDSGIALGIIEDFDYLKEEIDLFDEIILYTDGITDAINKNEEEYGKEKLLNFLNNFESDEEPIKPLLKNIDKFTQDEMQFDDMTLLYLKNKNTTP